MEPEFWLTAQQSTKTWNYEDDLDWIIVNPNAAGTRHQYTNKRFIEIKP
jgi:hypothetical protein